MRMQSLELSATEPAVSSPGLRRLSLCRGAHSLRIWFNGESLHAGVLLMDARTQGEKEEDRVAGRLKGPVIVFFQGHAQRPGDAYPFTSKLSLSCRSGIVVIPVCDTPYGVDKTWRGDSGKDVILMEVVRHELSSLGIRVNGYSPGSCDQVRVNGSGIGEGHCTMHTDLIAVGWSHGAILARRAAHAYPGSVTAMGQICPAGYEHLTPLELMARFAMESIRISMRMAEGHAGDTLRSAWGFTKGLAGDFARSIPDAVIHAHPTKILRIGRDIRDCSMYCDSSLLGLPHLEKISVIFGADDTCMSPNRILGSVDDGHIPEYAAARFRMKYYADAPSAGTNLYVDVLPGTHLAPVSHSSLYSKTLLMHLDKLSVS